MGNAAYVSVLAHSQNSILIFSFSSINSYQTSTKETSSKEIFMCFFKWGRQYILYATIIDIGMLGTIIPFTAGVGLAFSFGASGSGAVK